MNNICIYIFSFNRGDFLLNCLRSIEICAPDMRVCILDDNSTDEYTKSVLGDLDSRYAVIKNNNRKDVERKTGGLCGSMNMAMSMAKRDGVELALFIQDDMQFVRRISQIDLAKYSEYFQFITNSIQISTSFIRELSGNSFSADYDIDKNDVAYIRWPERERGKSSFSATGVFSVSRFHELFGRFAVGEGANSEKARNLGLVCGRAIHPNMCWLPYPPSYRGKRRSLKHRFFEKFGRSGFYPINVMTDQEEARFLERDRSIPPIMERFLSAPNSPRHDIWSTGGGEYNFTSYNGFFAKIFKAAKAGRRSLSSLKR